MGWIAIVPAAGSGSRLARPDPKAFVSLGGRMLVERALDMLRAVPFDRIAVAVPQERLPAMAGILHPNEIAVEGGPTRAQSVRRAFDALDPGPGDVVCLHDAARPLVSAEETARVMRAAVRVGAAIAATPLVDTLKRVDGRRVTGTVDREGLWAAATPQAFRGEILRRALSAAAEATDEASLCEALGVAVEVVPVSRLVFKVTTPEDLELAEAILARRDA
ncbi:MAG: 2-C-methyl-D-erythritol 4-phosphate cytidylyltransferase [Acidobacteria bacterium]|nr:2-C-methyl-D-erythritol 4-phosphate cytidylyltransferase [Acidobacteriota bacterium]MCA1610288.1 2-C-methyl-D-erythritol 4-phosphate cytidylyltransferase [Acidobacteriota bacterium]